MLDVVTGAGVVRGKFGEEGFDFAVTRGEILQRHDEAEGVLEYFGGGGVFELKLAVVAKGPSATDARPVGLIDEVAELLLLVFVFGEVAPSGIDDFAGYGETSGGLGAVFVVHGQVFDDVDGGGEDVGQGPNVFVPDVVGEVVSDRAGVLAESIGGHFENLAVDAVAIVFWEVSEYGVEKERGETVVAGVVEIGGTNIDASDLVEKIDDGFF